MEPSPEAVNFLRRMLCDELLRLHRNERLDWWEYAKLCIIINNLPPDSLASLLAVFTSVMNAIEEDKNN